MWSNRGGLALLVCAVWCVQLVAGCGRIRFELTDDEQSRLAGAVPFACDESAPALEPTLGAAWVIGGAGSQTVEALSLTGSGDVHVGGHFDETIQTDGMTMTSLGGQDGFVAGFDRLGTMAWLVPLAGETDARVLDLVSDAGGNVYAVGAFRGVVDVSGRAFSAVGGQDGFLLSLDPAGTVRWFFRFGGVGDDDMFSVALAPDGAVHVGAGFRGDVDLGAEQLRSSGHTAAVLTFATDGAYRRSVEVGHWLKHVAAGPSGEVYVSGVPSNGFGFDGMSYTPDGADVALARIGPDGQPGWLRLLTSSDGPFGGALTVTPEGHVVVTGSTRTVDLGGGVLVHSPNRDGFLASYDATSAHQWSVLFGGTGNDVGAALVSHADHLYVAGTLKHTACLQGPTMGTEEMHDIFVAHLALDGGPGWRFTAGSPEAEELTALAVDESGVAFVAGKTVGTLELEGRTLPVGDGTESFILRLDPP